MKKLILTALVAVVSLAANAQFWAGGEISFKTAENSFKGNKTATGTSLDFMPRIGYTLSDKVDLGVMLKYQHGNASAEVENYEGSMGSADYNTWAVAPFIRYKFFNTGDFTFFADGMVCYGDTHTRGVADNEHKLSIGIKPGISYALTEKVSLVAQMGRIGYNFVKRGDKKVNECVAGLDSESLSFGAYYHF